jgi:large subunit ribosomal protein L6
MSRLGKVALAIPDKVKVEYKDQAMQFQGPLGKLTLNIHRALDVKIEPKQVSVFQRQESKEANMMQGTYRGLIKNCLEGVSSGYKKELEVSGLGYKMSVEGQKLTLHVGYSVPQIFMLPVGVKAVVTNNTQLSLSGVDKAVVGETAARIRSIRKPEPYKATGIKYVGEHIIRKAGKAAAGAAGAPAGGAKK